MSDNFNSLDAYAEALQIQNNGGFCPHCNSALGHYSHCGLINRNAGEAQRAVASGLAEADAIALHGLGVCWEGDNR